MTEAVTIAGFLGLLLMAGLIALVIWAFHKPDPEDMGRVSDGCVRRIGGQS